MPTGVTFVVPTLNEARRLPRCLRSIRSQQYDPDYVEIIVADAGSQDHTVAIARQFDATVVSNELRLAEPGIAKGMQQARFPYCVALAADNALPHAGWLCDMVRPLDEHPTVGLSFTHIVNDPFDNAFNKYFNALHADPFNAFVYGYAAKPSSYHKHYRPLEQTDSYALYRFRKERYPLIALAQGTTVRRSLFVDRQSVFDDIAPVIDLVAQGMLFAYVPAAGIYHYSMSGLDDFVHKYRRRIANAAHHGYAQRARHHSSLRRARQYVWPAYSLAVLPAALAALRSAVRDRRPFHLYHPAACLLLSLMLARYFALNWHTVRQNARRERTRTGS